MLEPGIEWRRDRLPSITVRGAVPDDVQSNDVAKAVFAKLKPLRDGLPAGYRIEMQGAVEESAKSQASINEKMPVMLLVILVLLMIQLQHFGKTLLVLATGPLGLIGAAAALLLFQAPFGFVAILGVIALAGIIMRNSVILVDQIEQDMAAGHDAFTAIVELAVRRFRPIMLTAAAAVLALIPLAREVFWAPMACAMMGGLIAATVLTLTFLPALYALAFRVAVRKKDKAAIRRQVRHEGDRWDGPACRMSSRHAGRPALRDAPVRGSPAGAVAHDDFGGTYRLVNAPVSGDGFFPFQGATGYKPEPRPGLVI